MSRCEAECEQRADDLKHHVLQILEQDAEDAHKRKRHDVMKYLVSEYKRFSTAYEKDEHIEKAKTLELSVKQLGDETKILKERLVASKYLTEIKLKTPAELHQLTKKSINAAFQTFMNLSNEYSRKDYMDEATDWADEAMEYNEATDWKDEAMEYMNEATDWKDEAMELYLAGNAVVTQSEALKVHKAMEHPETFMKEQKRAGVEKIMQDYVSATKEEGLLEGEYSVTEAETIKAEVIKFLDIMEMKPQREGLKLLMKELSTNGTDAFLKKYTVNKISTELNLFEKRADRVEEDDDITLAVEWQMKWKAAILENQYAKSTKTVMQWKDQVENDNVMAFYMNNDENDVMKEMDAYLVHVKGDANGDLKAGQILKKKFADIFKTTDYKRARGRAEVLYTALKNNGTAFFENKEYSDLMLPLDHFVEIAVNATEVQVATTWKQAVLDGYKTYNLHLIREESRLIMERWEKEGSELFRDVSYSTIRSVIFGYYKMAVLKKSGLHLEEAKTWMKKIKNGYQSYVLQGFRQKAKEAMDKIASTEVKEWRSVQDFKTQFILLDEYYAASKNENYTVDIKQATTWRKEAKMQVSSFGLQYYRNESVRSMTKLRRWKLASYRKNPERMHRHVLKVESKLEAHLLEMQQRSSSSLRNLPTAVEEVETWIREARGMEPQLQVEMKQFAVTELVATIQETQERFHESWKEADLEGQVKEAKIGKKKSFDLKLKGKVDFLIITMTEWKNADIALTKQCIALEALAIASDLCDNRFEVQRDMNNTIVQLDEAKQVLSITVPLSTVEKIARFFGI